MGISVYVGCDISFSCARGVVESIAEIVNERVVRSAMLRKSMTEEELDRFNAIGGFIIDRWTRDDLLELDEILAAIEAGARPEAVVWNSVRTERVLKYVRLFRESLHRRLLLPD